MYASINVYDVNEERKKKDKLLTLFLAIFCTMRGIETRNTNVRPRETEASATGC